MKVRVSEMTEKQLDWAVGEIMEKAGEHRPYFPSTDWSEGGPIIEREGIAIAYEGGGIWGAAYGTSRDNSAWVFRNANWQISNSPTPLIAAMRAFVASKLGAVVEVPE